MIVASLNFRTHLVVITQHKTSKYTHTWSDHHMHAHMHVHATFIPTFPASYQFPAIFPASYLLSPGILPISRHFPGILTYFPGRGKGSRLPSGPSRARARLSWERPSPRTPFPWISGCRWWRKTAPPFPAPPPSARTDLKAKEKKNGFNNKTIP